MSLYSDATSTFHATSVVLVLLVVAATYHNRGWSKVFTICAYIVSLSAMSIALTYIYTENFHCVTFVMAVHFFLTSVASFGLLVCRGKGLKLPDLSSLLFGVVPISLTSLGSVGLSNHGIVLCGFHYFEMLCSWNLLVTACIGVFLGRSLDGKLWPPLLLLTFATSIVTLGQASASIKGTILIGCAIVLRAAKAQLQSLMMSRHDWSLATDIFEPIELVAWSGLGSFLVALVWCLFEDGFQPLSRAWHHPGVLVAVGISAVVAASVNIFGVMVIKELGAVGQQGAGKLRDAIACVAAVAALGEFVAVPYLVGYIAMVCGIFWYNRIDTRIREHAENIPLCIHSLSNSEAMKI